MRDIVVIDGIAYSPWGVHIELTDEEKSELEQLRRSLTADVPVTYLSGDDVNDLLRAVNRAALIFKRARRRLDTRPDGLS